MGMIEGLAHWWVRRAAAFELAVNEAKAKLAVPNGTYGLDAAFDKGLKLWFAAMDDWCGLFPSGRPPILFGTLNPGSRAFVDSISVGFFTATSLQCTPLIALRGTGVATAITAVQVPADDTIQFTIAFPPPPNLNTGDAYMAVCYDVVAVGKVQGIAILLLTVL